MAKAYAAALTPLRGGGDELDLDAIPAYVEFLARGGLDGILALGPTGEGIGDAWSAEAKRRLEEVRTGAVKPVPWEEAESQIFDPSEGRKGRRRGPKA